MERKKRIDALLSMLQTEPRDVFLNYSLALEYVADGNFVIAEQQFLKTLDLQADYIPAFYHIGKLYEQKHDLASALKFYRSGIEHAKKQGNNKALNELSEAIFMVEE